MSSKFLNEETADKCGPRKTANQAWKEYYNAEGSDQKGFNDWITEQKNKGNLDKLLGIGGLLLGGGASGGSPEYTPPKDYAPAPAGKTYIMGIPKGYFIVGSIVVVSLIGLGIYGLVRMSKKKNAGK